MEGHKKRNKVKVMAIIRKKKKGKENERKTMRRGKKIIKRVPYVGK